MMRQHKTQSAIWDDSQRLLPKQYRRIFDNNIGYCLHEKMLKESLISSGNKKLWEYWKGITRPEIINNRSLKYSSNEFSKQKKVEYARRAENWNELLKDLISGEGILNNDKIVNIGANEGDEVCGLPYNLTCIDPSKDASRKGKIWCRWCY